MTLKRGAYVKGRRSVTMTLRATPEDAAQVDNLARRFGFTRAEFLIRCANLGFPLFEAKYSPAAPSAPPLAEGIAHE